MFTQRCGFAGSAGNFPLQPATDDSSLLTYSETISDKILTELFLVLLGVAVLTPMLAVCQFVLRFIKIS